MRHELLPEGAAIIFWDIQTDGMDAITEIGAHDVSTGNRFHSLINPSKKNAPSSVDGKALADQPIFADVGPQFVQWVERTGQDVHLITKNNPFNERLLRQESQQEGHIRD